jgi:hypothetical protein
MDGVSVMLVNGTSLSLYVSSMMCRDLIARKASREKFTIFIIIMAGAAAIILLEAPTGYRWFAAAWIIYVIIFGWFSHRFVAS